MLLFSTVFAQQIVLVVTDDFQSATGEMYCVDEAGVFCESIPVNVGSNGLGWGIGIEEIPHKSDEPLKQEGDKKAPAGIFRLTQVFGYDEHNLSMPFVRATEELICVDEGTSSNYNKLVRNDGSAKSFEVMLRDDGLYKIGVVVAHNEKGVAGRGSCIFLHVQKGTNKPTLGCTSMSEETLQKLVKWLDSKQSPLLIQIAKRYMGEVLSRYSVLNKLNFSR